MNQQPIPIAHAVTQYPTPVFNTPELSLNFGGEDGISLPLDEQGLMRTVETVLFPGSCVTLLQKMPHLHIWRITADEYKYRGDFFIDDRFVKKTVALPPSRSITLPSTSAILDTLLALQNTPYVWGGNWPQGIDLLMQFYPSKTPFHQLIPHVRTHWQLQGLDCSGLIYYATNGWTPRNTSSLVHFGSAVPIEGKSAEDISEQLQALDLIVWEGHVLCVLDRHSTLESRPSRGVVKFSSIERLTEILSERKAVDDWDTSSEPRFVVRRWHPEKVR